MGIDGHDMVAILQALDEAEQLEGRLSVIVARTIKGTRVLLEHFGLRPQDIMKATHQAMNHKTS